MSIPPDGADAPSHEQPEAPVEQQQESTGVSRGQNQLHVLPEDDAAAAALIAPLLDRVDAGVASVQVLVVTMDAEAAVGIATRLAASGETRGLMAVSESRRASRLLKTRTPPVIAGAPEHLHELVRGSALKLEGVRLVVLAWVDALDERHAPMLEALMAEVPREAARHVIASAMTPAVEQLVERYAWRARRMQPAATEPLPAVSLSYVVTAESGRSGALRRTLDALDPDTAFVVARDAGSRAAVEALLRSLGHADGTSVRVGEAPEGPASLVVLYDLPQREEELRALARSNAGARIVALVTPRQLASLRSMAGGTVTPLALPDAAIRARAREERLRDELRQVLEAGQFSRELLTLEPLLGDYDGVEVAAAALRLLDAERGRLRTPQQQAQPAGGVTRLFINVGSVDEVRPGDLVGAITNEAGISKSELGRVDVRERHATVEVASSVANVVVEKLTGVQIRGRRVVARVDEDKPRERPHRSGGDRGERRSGSRPPNRNRSPRR